jgi:hypothetical protein
MSSISIWLFHENDCSNVEEDLKRNEASEIACKARKVRHLVKYRLQCQNNAAIVLVEGDLKIYGSVCDNAK